MLVPFRMTTALYTEGDYARLNPSWHVEDSPWKARQIAGLLADHTLAPHSVCEVGCGAGAVLAALQPALPHTRFVGYDVSPDAIAIARPRSNEMLSFVQGSPIPAEPFDLMLAIDVIEHIEDYFGFLRAIAPQARRHIFHIPLEMHVSAVARVAPLIAARRGVGHLHYFSRETALAALRETGYAVIAERFTHGGAELQQKRLRARLATLPRAVAGAISPGLAARWLGGFSLLVLATADRSLAPA